jgi:arabinofuranosyltransferase
LKEARPSTGAPPEDAAARETSLAGVRFLAAGLLLFLVVRVAWVGDDAFITLRTVDNLLHGYGLRWNTVERVQAFTHPLWLLVLVPFAALLQAPVLQLLVPSFLFAGAAFLACFRRASTPAGLLGGFLVFALSRSLIDFSTSGLENPLTYLLLVLLMASTERTPVRPLEVALAGSLLLLNRLDLVFLALPVAAAAMSHAGRRPSLRALALGASPLVAWLLFATVYYGTPLPNTYHAKLGAGIPAWDFVRQGGRYLVDLLFHEPATVLIPVLGVAAGLSLGGWRARAAAAGLVLQTAYVVRVGGDFMSARFLTPQVVVSGLLIMRWLDARLAPVGTRAGAAAGIAASFLVVLAAGVHPLEPEGRSPRPSGLVDERAFFRPFGSLSHLVYSDGFELENRWTRGPRELRVQGRREVLVSKSVGWQGYFAGPEVHVIDAMGLADAFVARLPARPGPWRIGHLEREVPDEYVRSVKHGENRLTDPALAALYEDVVRVTRARLFSRGRLGAMWRLHGREPVPVPAPSVSPSPPT